MSADLSCSDLSRISIVVPVLNEASGLQAALEPLQVWRQNGAELLVVDGGSDDGTPELARGLADQVLSGTSGRARQMNAGADAARGDLLLFHHVDSRLPEIAPGLLAALPERVWGRFDVDLTPGHWMFPVIAALMNLRSRITGIATGDQSIFVSRSLFQQVGGFPDQPLMEDIELSSRLRAVQRPCALRARVVTSSRRWQKHGVWRTIWLMWRLRLAYFFGADAADLAAIYYPGRVKVPAEMEKSH